VALAAAIARTDGLSDAPRLSEQMQIFTRGDDCTRDDQHRDYFIFAHARRATPISEWNQNIGDGVRRRAANVGESASERMIPDCEHASPTSRRFRLDAMPTHHNE
jgi:hypothetical protein